MCLPCVLCDLLLLCAVQASNATQIQDCAYDPNCRYDLVWNKNMEYAFIYHFFGLLWTNQFIIGFG